MESHARCQSGGFCRFLQVRFRPFGRRQRGRAWGAPAAAAAALALGLVVPAAGSFGAAAPPLELTGMTFVASQGDHAEIVVQAKRAQLLPDENLAELEGVRAELGPKDSQQLDVSCDRGEFNVATSDLLASGHVRGHTADGKRFSTAWIRYDHATGLVYTDAPVELVDERGTYRGGGFRYRMSDGRMQLLGGASVVQNP